MIIQEFSMENSTGIFYGKFLCYVPVNSKTVHLSPSPPMQTPGHLTFLENFGQIPRYVASLDS